MSFLGHDECFGFSSCFLLWEHIIYWHSVLSSRDNPCRDWSTKNLSTVIDTTIWRLKQFNQMAFHTGDYAWKTSSSSVEGMLCLAELLNLHFLRQDMHHVIEKFFGDYFHYKSRHKMLNLRALILSPCIPQPIIIRESSCIHSLRSVIWEKAVGWNSGSSL